MDVKEATAFLRDRAKTEEKVGKDGALEKIVSTVTQSDYLELMKGEGIEKSVLTALVAADRKVIDAGVHVATELLTEAVKKQRDAGNDPSAVKAIVNITRPHGRVEVIETAHTTPTNLRTGEKLDKYGSVKVKVNLTNVVSTEASQAAQSAIRAAFGA